MLEAGITTNPGSYDPLENPYNRVQSSLLMAYFGAGFFSENRFRQGHTVELPESGFKILFPEGI